LFEFFYTQFVLFRENVRNGDSIDSEVLRQNTEQPNAEQPNAECCKSNRMLNDPMPNAAERQMPNAEQLKLKEIARIIIIIVPTLPNLT
jgi:hypothetical protein